MRMMLGFLALAPLLAQNPVVVSGRITDAITGRPVEGASVALKVGGDRQMHFTDAGGAYSFDPVAPGSATIEIGAPGFLAFQKTNPDEASIQIAADHAMHSFRLTPTSSIAGRISVEDSDGKSPVLNATLYREDFTDGVRHFVSGERIAALDRDGAFLFTGLEAGRYVLSAGPQTVPFGSMVLRARSAGSISPSSDGYAATYYPGTTEFSAALPLALQAGETKTADFKLTKRPFFQASGELTGIESWQGRIAVLANEMLQDRGYSGSLTAAGHFVIEGLPPGQYSIKSMSGPGGFPVLPVDLSFAVTDHDLENLRMARMARPDFEIPGVFRMANAGALPGGLTVQYAFPEPGGKSDSIPAAGTGEFSLRGVAGNYSVQPVVPANYAVTEVRYGGANYLNSLLPLGENADASLTIVLSDKPGSAGGSLLDKDRKPVAATISLVPDPLPANFDFRAIRVAKTDAAGNFAFSGLAPGKYKAVPLTGDDRKRDHDMALLSDKLRLADSIEVKAGQAATINVRP